MKDFLGEGKASGYVKKAISSIWRGVFFLEMKKEMLITVTVFTELLLTGSAPCAQTKARH